MIEKEKLTSSLTRYNTYIS